MPDLPKHLKLLNLAADASIIARNRMADAIHTAHLENHGELASALMTLHRALATVAETAGTLIEHELHEHKPSEKASE